MFCPPVRICFPVGSALRSLSHGKPASFDEVVLLNLQASNLDAIDFCNVFPPPPWGLERARASEAQEVELPI